ncbi:MAG: hypothetical protein IIC21_09115 [Chloroflexi bacterium]|nr:hypothetical protein [Chloroflexota bacterium]
MMLEESIQSKRQEVWTRLYDMLDLNPGAPAPGGRGRVAMMIRPVISVDALLTIPTIRRETKEQTTSTITYFVVPVDERWLLHGYQATVQGGDRDIIGMVLRTPANLDLQSIFVDEFAAASSRRHMFQAPIPVGAEWSVRLDGDGGTTDGDWQLLLYMSVTRSFQT